MNLEGRPQDGGRLRHRWYRLRAFPREVGLVQVLGSRRGGIVVLIIAGVAFAAAAVFAMVQLLKRWR